MKVFFFQNSTPLCLLRAYYAGDPLEATRMFVTLFNLPSDRVRWVVWYRN